MYLASGTNNEAYLRDPLLARVDPPADVAAFIREHLYKPEYRNLA
jgi:hypothetical protein